MSKVDYKKTYKELYVPKGTPVIVDVPSMSFFMIEGAGDPNGDEFALATAALYSLSYAVKMSYKSKNVPEGYYEYTVFPLEGVWDLVDKSKPHTDKNNLAYQIMIRQPDFVTNELFESFLSEIKKKKPNAFLDKLKYITITEGLCCQMMHLGSYDSEPESFRRMEEYCRENGYERAHKTHREIYLSDPRKSKPEDLKTVLRFLVKESN
jgi:hypothetical protein